MRECVCADDERASSAGEHYNHVCTCKFCARVLEIFSSLLSYCSSSEWLKPQCLSVQWFWLKRRVWDNAGSCWLWWIYQQTPCQRVMCAYMGRGRVFCPPHPLYCKMSNTGISVCVCVYVSVCVRACVHAGSYLSDCGLFSFPQQEAVCHRVS